MIWPKQSECDAFYGNPRGAGHKPSAAWEKANLVLLTPPFQMHMGKAAVPHMRVHRKCAGAFAQWLDGVWVNAGKDPAKISQWGMDVFSGSYCFRPMRGLGTLSMHAYGAALDIDAPRNPMGNRAPHFATLIHEVVKPFLDLGGTWGGDWNGNGQSADERRCDGMHFQFAHPG